MIKRMFKPIFLSSLAVIAVLSLSACNFNHGGDQSASVDHKAPSISVTGQAERLVEPNQAEVSFTVENRAAAQNTVRNNTNQAIQAITTHLTQSIGIKAEKLQTTNLIIRPVYQRCRPVRSDDNDAKCDRTKIDHYTARITLSVTVNNLTQLSDVIDGALDNGANRMAGLEFSRSDRDALMREVRADAMRDAIANAKSVLRAADKQIGDPISINVSASHGTPPQPYRAMTRSVQSKQTTNTPVNPGQITLNANVQASFEIILD